jgi:hypothetical protein
MLLRQENDGRNLEDLPWMLAQLNVDQELIGKVIASYARPELTAAAKKISTVDEFVANLAALNEKIIEQARKFKVVLRGDGYFGFTETLQRGHVSEKIANRDNIELHEIAALLQLLFESSSGDVYFIGIEREGILPVDLSMCRNDFFDAGFVSPIRKTLGVESHIYRLRFRSKTDTFRTFFNALEENMIPVVPHSIIISTPRRNPRLEEGNRSVVVHSRPTEFSIVFEWIHLPPADAVQKPVANSR